MTGGGGNNHLTRLTKNNDNNSPSKNNNYTSPTKLIKSPTNCHCSTCNTTNPTFSKSQLKKKTDRKCIQCIEKLNSNTPPTSSKKSKVNTNNGAPPDANQPSVQHNDNEINTSSSPQSTKKEKKRKKRKRSKKDNTVNEQQADSSTNEEIIAQQQHKDYEECRATVSKYFQTNNMTQQSSSIMTVDKLDIGTNSDSDDTMKVTKSNTAAVGKWNDDEFDASMNGLDDTPADKHKKHKKKHKHKKDKKKSKKEKKDKKSSKSNANSASTSKMSSDGDNDISLAAKYDAALASLSNNNNNGKKRSVRTKMEMARAAALGDNNSTANSSDGSTSSADEMDMKQQPPHNQNNNTESIEELKQSIMGRQIKSMYDIDHNAEAQLSSSLSNGIPALNSTTLNRETAVANELRNELSCPICHDILYNPTSLLCGHTFCIGCLNWWFDRQSQSNANGNGVSALVRDGSRRTRAMMGFGPGGDGGEIDDESNEEESEWHGTCPTCRTSIPPSLSDSTMKPTLQVNTCLKVVLDTLYTNEMNQRRQVELKAKAKATRGENNGLHDRGCEEIEMLKEEDDELDYVREMIRRDRGGEVGSKKRNKYKDEEAGWITLHSSTNQPGWQDDGVYNHGNNNNNNGIMIRRNIVLDESDQRYQISLGLTKCTYSSNNKSKAYAAAAKSNNNNNEVSSQYGILDIELCLLTMEEDEVDDSGFPTFVYEGDDDEALICTSDDKIHSCVEAVVRVISLSELDTNRNDDDKKMPAFGSRGGDTNASPQVRELSLSRGMIGRDGSVRFRIDLTKALEGSGNGQAADDLLVVKLRFTHADTGAVLELRVPSKSDTDEMEDDGEIEYCGKKPSAVSKNDGSRFLLDDEDEDDDEPNEYVDDGFVVNGSQSEDESSSDDDDGECQICKNGGDLIICDGGDEEGGCGDMYHLSCIGRSVVPPGDWICKKCANEIGMNVGIEGYEYKEEGDNEDDDEVQEVEAPTNNNPLTIDDSDDEEEIVLPKKKRLKRTILEPESDSD